jgi:hypothetical protein
MDLEELVYEPVRPNFYNYYAKKLLNKNINEFKSFTNLDKIKIVAYEVNNNGIYPFLQILLFKQIFSSVLSFPYIPLNSNSMQNNMIETEEILKIVNLFLFTELSLSEKYSYQLFETNTIFDGFYEYNGEIYLFVDVTQHKLNLHDVYSDSIIRFVLIDEILNQKNVCNINITKNVTDFFNSNYQFSILKDEKNEPYEVPLVGYVGSPENKLNFIYIFGTLKQNKNALLGPYYYFTGFTNAVKENINNSNLKNGVVRFAVFPKNTKYIENHQNDDIDESETKKMRLQDETLDLNYERLTMRISDYDGKWTQNYDSCYLGHIELDNGMYLKNTPILVVKEYNQQVPLSYHYNKSLQLESGDYAIV